MELLDKIDSFAADIYFKMPFEIKKQYAEVCVMLSDFLDVNFAQNTEIMEQKQELLKHLLSLMEGNDYIRMADALCYEVKPIIEDTLSVNMPN